MLENYTSLIYQWYYISHNIIWHLYAISNINGQTHILSLHPSKTSSSSWKLLAVTLSHVTPSLLNRIVLIPSLAAVFRLSTPLSINTQSFARHSMHKRARANISGSGFLMPTSPPTILSRKYRSIPWNFVRYLLHIWLIFSHRKSWSLWKTCTRLRDGR